MRNLIFAHVLAVGAGAIGCGETGRNRAGGGGAGGAQGGADGGQGGEDGDQGGKDGAQEGEDGALGCVAGRTLACPCGNGLQGTQTCSEDGRRFSECECDAIVAGEGEGESAAGDGDISDAPRADRTRCTKIEAVAVEAAGFSIFKYEAVRPNATGEDAGCRPSDTDDDGHEDDCEDLGLPACSEAGLMPWTKVTKPEAAAACERSGYRLCTEREWLLACGGPDHKSQPYGQIFRAGWCNDHKGGAGELEKSGSRERCVSDHGAIDLVGTAWEWIGDFGDGGEDGYLGYSFQPSAIRPTADPACDAGLQADIEAEDARFSRDDIGFRCCKSLD